MKKIATCTLFILLLSTLSFAQQAREYQLKAAFIHRFTLYIEFPNPPTLSDPIIIGIVGKGDSYSEMKNFFSIQKIKEHPVKVINILNTKDLALCHIVFVEDESQLTLKDIQATLTKQERKILTIGDKADMANRGLIVAFYLVNNKTKFRINNNKAKTQGIKVSSFLLQMAEIVETE